MKKIRSLNLNTKILLVGMLLPLGFLGTFLLNNFLKETYSSRKLELEKSIENLLDKNVDLGDYVGIRFLGISLGNSKINDKKNIDSEIKAKNVYVGIMPFRSFLKQKWIVKISPKEAAINIDRDFFKRDESYKNVRSTKKSQSKYELNFNLNKYSDLKFNKAGLKTKVKGNVIYKSRNRQIIANVKSNFDEKGFLKLKFNTKLNQDFLKLVLFSKGLDLENSEYIIGNRKISFKKGTFKSNFKFNKSSKRTFCEGRFSFSNLKIKPEDFAENINSDSTRFFCKDNNLIGNTEKLNYGTLTSNFNLNVPFNKSSNNINLIGSIGYINSLNPDIKLSGNMPYWFDRRGINFGDIDTSFKINRTQLSNLNIFRKNDIRGFITAKGELKGKITDPDISINFNVDYPHFKGIRIRETWEGDIKNENNEFLLNMKNRYSPIPSFLSIKFDSDLKLDNANFIRVFNSNKGTIGIVNEDDGYIWRADNFPLDELELSLYKNQFDKIDGIINGEGSISSDQSSLVGRLAWSLGKYRNINLANSLFDFRVKNNYFYINSSLYPIDGGVIEVEFDSNKNEFINSEFTNVSTSWTILTAVDIFNFDNKKVIPISKSNILDDLEINKDNNSFKERIDFINNYTALIRGHSDPDVTAAVSKVIHTGTAFSLPTEYDIRLAELLVDRIPAADQVRFCNSGSEAVLLAIRAARAYTGRSKIAKFEGCYHGIYDYAQASDSSRPGNWGELDSPQTTLETSMVPNLGKDVVTLPWNRPQICAQLIEDCADELAAVLIDPLPAALGLLSPAEGFLETLRELTRELPASKAADIGARLIGRPRKQLYQVALELKEVPSAGKAAGAKKALGQK